MGGTGNRVAWQAAFRGWLFSVGGFALLLAVAHFAYDTPWTLLALLLTLWAVVGAPVVMLLYWLEASRSTGRGRRQD